MQLRVLGSFPIMHFLSICRVKFFFENCSVTPPLRVSDRWVGGSKGGWVDQPKSREGAPSITKQWPEESFKSGCCEQQQSLATANAHGLQKGWHAAGGGQNQLLRDHLKPPPPSLSVSLVPGELKLTLFCTLQELAFEEAALEAQLLIVLDEVPMVQETATTF